MKVHVKKLASPLYTVLENGEYIVRDCSYRDAIKTADTIAESAFCAGVQSDVCVIDNATGEVFYQRYHAKR